MAVFGAIEMRCIVSNLSITTGARPVVRILVRAAILRCLHARIIRLKSAYVMLAAIMSLIALFKSKYCVCMVKINHNIAKNLIIIALKGACKCHVTSEL